MKLVAKCSDSINLSYQVDLKVCIPIPLIAVFSSYIVVVFTRTMIGRSTYISTVHHGVVKPVVFLSHAVNLLR